MDSARAMSSEFDSQRGSSSIVFVEKLAASCLLREHSPRKLGVESVVASGGTTAAAAALTLTSQRRPRPSSTVRRDDDVMLAAKDDAISGVMHRRRRRRRRRYRRVGEGGGGGGGDGGSGRRGFSDGRTFLLHVATVSLLSPSSAFARGFRASGILPACLPADRGTGTRFSFDRDARDASIDRGKVNATSQSFDDGSPEATSSGKEASLCFCSRSNPPFQLTSLKWIRCFSIGFSFFSLVEGRKASFEESWAVYSLAVVLYL